MGKSVYFDTSVFVEMGAKKSKHKKSIRALLAELQAEKTRIYTSVITVQELSVAAFRRGTVVKDTYGVVSRIARIYSVTKDTALTAAKREAEWKDMADFELSKRDPTKPETEDQKLERICENRRRKFDCFHIATAQTLECPVLYSADDKMQKRTRQLGLKNLEILPPSPTVPTIKGPLLQRDSDQHRQTKGKAQPELVSDLR